MSRWFRFYAEATRNPKVLRLSDKDFRLWVRLLAVAAENDGQIPPLEDLRLVLSMRLDHLQGGVDRLISGRLIDALDDGYEPHGWAKFQYKSDVSTSRVQKHREKRNVSETPPETDTEADTELAPKGACASGDAPADDFTFEDFFESWNEVATDCGLPIMPKALPRRRKTFRVRKREYPDIADWRKAFATLRGAAWMHGDNKTGWRADPDFFLQAKSFTKLVEGSYGQTD